jgi:hypothetical protein
MNPDDIIKAAPAIAKVAGPLAAAVPFTAIVKRMLGPAADELAEMWRDQEAHASIATFTQVGIGAVRTRLCFPTS